MTEITKDHVKWAVVDRMRRMLEEPPSADFGVTETYALFTTTLCWVLQHLRIPENEAVGPTDEAARHLWATLQKEKAFDPPWLANTAAFRRLVVVDEQNVPIPSALGMTDHSAARFLKNLRDAVAHGDARCVEPFNHGGVLLGFTFTCREKATNTSEAWEAGITLLQSDMKHIGVELARRYCIAIQTSTQRYAKEAFEGDAASIVEKAAA